MTFFINTMECCIWFNDLSTRLKLNVFFFNRKTEIKVKPWTAEIFFQSEEEVDNRCHPVRFRSSGHPDWHSIQSIKMEFQHSASMASLPSIAGFSEPISEAEEIESVSKIHKMDVAYS